MVDKKNDTADEVRSADMTKVIEACAAIRADIKADVHDFEGQAFTGSNVSRMYGNLAACVDALAAMVTLLAERAAESVRA